MKQWFLWISFWSWEVPENRDRVELSQVGVQCRGRPCVKSVTRVPASAPPHAGSLCGTHRWGLCWRRAGSSGLRAWHPPWPQHCGTTAGRVRVTEGPYPWGSEATGTPSTDPRVPTGTAQSVLQLILSADHPFSHYKKTILCEKLQTDTPSFIKTLDAIFWPSVCFKANIFNRT